MPKRVVKKKAAKRIESLKHKQAKRKNIPTKEMESVVKDEDKAPRQVAYQRRNRDLDPQLVWRGKDEQDLSDLLVQAPPLYIQEKIQAQVLIDDLKRQSEASQAPDPQADMFADFNGLPSEQAKTEFYEHDANWSNRMILGDSLQAMASLAEREGLRGKVQMIYMDPPYGIKFNSNFQWSTTSRDVKDGKRTHITREPEMVKAFRDTWRDGIHSYLSYLRDRLEVARDLLTESGSCFVQIGDENVHRVRAVMDEVFGEDNFVSLIAFQKTSGQATKTLSSTLDFIIWYAKNAPNVKYRDLFVLRKAGEKSLDRYDCVMDADGSCRRLSGKELKIIETNENVKRYQLAALYSDGSSSAQQEFSFLGKNYKPRLGTHWKTTVEGLKKLSIANRIEVMGSVIRYRRFADDFPVIPMTDRWDSVQLGVTRKYIVETSPEVIKRCLLMTTDPGDLVLDPTCGSGTTAYVAEQWGRRWITMDTSRVSLALARARIMGARYSYYLLADTPEGQQKEAEITHTLPKETPTYEDIRQGFVYQRVPHITLKSIANNAEIDVIYDKWEKKIAPLREALSDLAGTDIALTARSKGKPVVDPSFILGTKLVFDEDWQIYPKPDSRWSEGSVRFHKEWLEACIARQKEIDESIAAKAATEYLYDKPYEDNKRVRVAGPFTVESLLPHRAFVANQEGEEMPPQSYHEQSSFMVRMMETLKIAGVQQAHKENKINFSALDGFPGQYICAQGQYDTQEGKGDKNRNAAIFIGPEYGTLSRDNIAAAAREAAEAGFDMLITCAFNYEANCAELKTIGKITILQARMNADLHMATDLKDSKNANLFVVFGEPDIDIETADDHKLRVRLKGVDVFKPATGEVVSSAPDEIAMWFVDSDYNGESFFVRQAYFLGASDPYKGLKTTLKADINKEAWDTLYGEVSREFDKPSSGRIAVKVINHLGDEVMKIFDVK